MFTDFGSDPFLRQLDNTRILRTEE